MISDALLTRSCRQVAAESAHFFTLCPECQRVSSCREGRAGCKLICGAKCLTWGSAATTLAYAGVGRAMPHCSAKLGSMMHSTRVPSGPADIT